MARAISARRLCEVCGRLLRADSKYGICETNPACRRVKAERYRRSRGIKARRRTIICGDSFGRWIVMEDYAGTGEVLCRCECGMERIVGLNLLTTGKSKSCGCSRRRQRPRAAPYIAAGEVYGRLTALENARVCHDQLRLRCECGAETVTTARLVRYGRTVSCGCKRRSTWLTHGLSQHPLRPTWWQVWARTSNPTHMSYADYGGRGIRLYPDWHGMPDGFRRFAEWIDSNLGPRPKGCTLDRIDNDRGYEPGNLRWASSAQQRGNRRTVAALTAERDALLTLLSMTQEATGRLF